MSRLFLSLLLIILSPLNVYAASESKVIMDFETPEELKLWQTILYDPKTEKTVDGKLSSEMLSDQHATHGMSDAGVSSSADWPS